MSYHDHHDAMLAQRTAARKSLSRFWLGAVGVAVIVLVGVAQMLLRQWAPDAVGRWAIIAGLAIFYELRIFKQIIPLMHRSGEEALLTRVGPGMALTLLAGLSYALLAGFLMVTPPAGRLGWLPAGLIAVAVLADAMDGPISRQRNEATVGGRHLSREFRALGTLVATAVAIHYGKLDSWFLIIGIMDYLALFSMSWLGRKNKPLHAPPAPRPRHLLQMLYLASLSVILWPVVTWAYAMTLGILFGLPYFFIAIRDWFILTGLLNPDQSQYQQVARAVHRALTGWLALAIRLIAAMAAITLLADMLFHFDVYAAAFGGALAPGLLLGLLVTATPFLLLGVRARVAAFFSFVAFSGVILVLGQSAPVLTGVITSGLTLILGQGELAVEKSRKSDGGRIV